MNKNLKTNMLNLGTLNIAYLNGGTKKSNKTSGGIVDDGCIRFKDPEVLRVLLANGVDTDGDGGITEEEAAAVTDINNWFENNTLIESFNEFEKFSVITYLGSSNMSKQMAFSKCTSLISITLPQGLYKIYDGTINYDGNGGFFGCSSLEYIGNIHVLKEIGAYAFYNCTSLAIEDLSLPNLEELGQNAFYGVSIKKISNLGKIPALPAATTSTQNFGKKDVLEEVVLPDTVTSIPNYSFLNYSALSNLIMSNESITSIGQRAFMNTALGSSYIVNFPNLADEGLADRIWANSGIERFENLGKITKTQRYGNGSTFGASAKFVRLPSTLTEMQGLAFFRCSKLETVIIEAIIPPIIMSSEFNDTNSTFFIYVPDASVTAYKEASGWVDYADRIRPLSEYTE